MDKLDEAGCSLIGGHSINDEEVKFGFAVTGLIDAKKTVERDNAKPGDVLVLTKPLGTGMVSFAAQIGRVSRECLDEVGSSMATLNKDAAELMVKHKAHACTDITGYALAGHLVEMVRGSGVTAELDMSTLPVFAAVEECIKHEILPGAIERNQEYAMAWVRVADTAGEKNLPTLYDPQTSGGLLIALPEKTAQPLVEEMHNRGHTSTSVIGRIVEKDAAKPEGEVVIVNSKLQNFIGKREVVTMSEKQDAAVSAPAQEPLSAAVDEPCCASPPGGEEAAAADVLSMFTDFMKEANRAGLIDKRAKKLMAVALSISQHCEPCLEAHLKSALAMGISKAEIDEVANLAISFGGCTAMMFYKDVCKELGV
jgi:AhpD family alkylhydroperoxidase